MPRTRRFINAMVREFYCVAPWNSEPRQVWADVVEWEFRMELATSELGALLSVRGFGPR